MITEDGSSADAADAASVEETAGVPAYDEDAPAQEWAAGAFTASPAIDCEQACEPKSYTVEQEMHAMRTVMELVSLYELDAEGHGTFQEFFDKHLFAGHNRNKLQCFVRRVQGLGRLPQCKMALTVVLPAVQQVINAGQQQYLPTSGWLHELMDFHTREEGWMALVLALLQARSVEPEFQHYVHVLKLANRKQELMYSATQSLIHHSERLREEEQTFFLDNHEKLNTVNDRLAKAEQEIQLLKQDILAKEEKEAKAQKEIQWLRQENERLLEQLESVARLSSDMARDNKQRKSSHISEF